MPEVQRVIFVYGYSKSVREDMTPSEKRELEGLAAQLKREDIEAARSKFDA